MSKKISELSAATTPLTGTELLPMVQGGRNVRAGVGVAQVLEAFGDLPTGGPVGRMIYVPDAAGGATPAYWNGTAWVSVGGGSGGGRVKPMGPGLWIVGIGASFGAAAAQGLDASGAYFVSLNGKDWYLQVNPHIHGGIDATSYANGCFLMSGIFAFNNPYAIVTTSTDPFDPTEVNQWNADPPLGYNIPSAFTTANDATQYNNSTGEFTVPIVGVGDITVLNQLPSALTPDTTWPHNGQTVEPVLGVGTAGPVEVAVQSVNITLAEAPAGIWNTSQLVWRSPGTSVWKLPTGGAGELGGIPVFSLITANPAAAGIQFRGLVWGPVKQTAVRFQPGG